MFLSTALSHLTPSCLQFSRSTMAITTQFHQHWKCSNFMFNPPNLNKTLVEDFYKGYCLASWPCIQGFSCSNPARRLGARGFWTTFSLIKHFVSHPSCNVIVQKRHWRKQKGIETTKTTLFKFISKWKWDKTSL